MARVQEMGKNDVLGVGGREEGEMVGRKQIQEVGEIKRRGTSVKE